MTLITIPMTSFMIAGNEVLNGIKNMTTGVIALFLFLLPLLSVWIAPTFMMVVLPFFQSD